MRVDGAKDNDQPSEDAVDKFLPARAGLHALDERPLIAAICDDRWLAA